MAPEYLIGRIVTAKADIYNLGVIIIEIITGSKVNIFSFSSPTSCQKFVDGVRNCVYYFTVYTQMKVLGWEIGLFTFDFS